MKNWKNSVVIYSVARGKLENTRTVSQHVVEGDRMDHLGKATENHPIHVYFLRHHKEGSRLIYVPELIPHGRREGVVQGLTNLYHYNPLYVRVFRRACRLMVISLITIDKEIRCVDGSVHHIVHSA